ncbi:hypothetical protein Tco_1000798 [Tanacetum coccineum]
MSPGKVFNICKKRPPKQIYVYSSRGREQLSRAENEPRERTSQVDSRRKSPSEFDHPIENPSEINLLEINFGKSLVDGVRYVVQSRDERRTTQNNGICAPGPDGEMSYGQLQEILEFKYLSFKVALKGGQDALPPPGTRRNLGLKKITDDKGPVPIRFEWDDKKTMMAPRTPILTVKPSHSIQSLDKYQFGHPTAFAKVYTIPTRFSPGSALDWDAQLAFWNDPRNLARAAQNRQNRAKKHSLCSLSLTLEDVEAAASRLQHRDGCALHRRRDHGHRSKGQAAGAPSRLFESSLEFRGASESGGCGDDEPGGDEDVTRMRRMRNLLEIMRAPPSRSRKSPGNESLASFPLQLIPGDMSPEIGFPSDKSPGKAWKYHWGLW